MKKILIFSGRYLPGHKDGGPLRTLVNITEMLGDEYNFYIVCLDRDHGDNVPYSNIYRDAWNNVGKAKVWYVKPGGFTNKLILKLSNGMDKIYLCSFYDDYGYKTLFLKRCKLINQPVYLASMGVFSSAALDQKALKKKMFIGACKLVGLFRDITWSVTSEIEADDLKKVIGDNAKYVVAEDLPRNSVPGRLEPHHSPIRIVFLSRICAHKGLDVAIDAIEAAKCDCVFTIYGPIQEKEYWENCKKKMFGLNWKYGGDVPSDDVQNRLSREDIFILPTRSENYGHVIFEAMSVGCIPVISDQTPWKDLDKERVGYEVPLNKDNFVKAINNFNGLSLKEREDMSERAINYARKKVEESACETGYRKIFG